MTHTEDKSEMFAGVSGVLCPVRKGVQEAFKNVCPALP